MADAGFSHGRGLLAVFALVPPVVGAPSFGATVKAALGAWPLLLIVGLIVLLTSSASDRLDRRTLTIGWLSVAASAVDLGSVLVGVALPTPVAPWMIGVFLLTWTSAQTRRKTVPKPAARMVALAEDSRGTATSAFPVLGWLTLAFEQAADAIAIADLEGNVRFVNEAWARMHAYEAGTTRGHGLRLFHTPEQAENELEPLLERAREEGSARAEIGHRKRDGQIFATHTRATLLLDTSQSPIGFLLTARRLR